MITIKTLKDFLLNIKDEIDVCDSTIECPYCAMSLIDKVEDGYDKFIDYIESNVEFDFYNPNSCVGELVVVKYLELIKQDIKVWIKFTDEVHNEEYQFSNYDDEDDFIENCLCYTLEKMLVGNYSEEDYQLFMKLIDESKEN